MNQPKNIRNISIIAHVDHGKSTLTDSLLAKAGIISSKQAGEMRFTDNMEEEKNRGITIKSTGVSLYYEEDFAQQGQKEAYIINLIDSPGHVDFSSEVTAALRVTDGALVVVDAVEGVCVQTETVLRQACAEKIRPVLMINKVDRAILETQKDGEQMYQSFVEIIDKVNVTLSTYLSSDMGEIILSPELGNIAFGAGKDCWGFTLKQFARMYSKKFNCDEKKMQQRLWGDNYYDAQSKKWKKDCMSDDGKTVLKRAFVEFVLDPIIRIHKAIMQMGQGSNALVQRLIDSLNIKLTTEEMKLEGKKLLKPVMSNWMNAADSLVDMIVNQLPSPVEAMKYRTSLLYEGPQDDEIAEALRQCNPKGPLMMYVSKMVPTLDFSKFYAFGRVFSGTVSAGQKVRILGANYHPGSKSDVFEKTIPSPVIMMGRSVENIDSIPCGNTAALQGIDNYLVKTGTITDHPQAFAIRGMKYSVSPVVRVAVGPQNSEDLPKLIAGLQKLSKSDPLIQCTQDEQTGEYIISGSGELHVEICIKQLEKDFAKCPLKISNPIVNYRETVTEESNQICLAKSGNKLNRLFGKMMPLGEDLTKDIDDKKITSFNITGFDQKLGQPSPLFTQYNWDKNEAKKIWCFGPENEGPNLLVDGTTAVQGLREIKDSIVQGFQWGSKQGVLAEEECRGCRFNILDALVHTDPVHRGQAQIVPTMRRLYYSTQLTAQPRIQEPIFLCEITVPQEAKNNVYGLLSKRRSIILDEQIVANTPLCVVRAHLPVSESFGFAEKMREVTQGKAFPQCVFDVWMNVPGDPLVEGTKSNLLVKEIRKRKGLKEQLPNLNDYLDNL